MKTEQVKNVQEEPAVLDRSVDQAKTDDFPSCLPELGASVDGILKFDASGNSVFKVDALVDGILKFDASGNSLLEVSASVNQ